MVKRIVLLLLILINIGCDQVSKNVVRKSIGYGEKIDVLNDNLVLTKIENPGAALGLGLNLPPLAKKVLLNFVPLFFLLGLTIYGLRKKHFNRLAILAFSFIIGGGLGNLIDRFVFGSVTDFFQISLGFFKTGIFNMADVSVTIGALLILIISFTNHEKTL